MPQGTILKINSGHLSSYGAASFANNVKYYTGFLKINNDLIVGADTAYGAEGSTSIKALILRINPENAIWAPSNATVILGVEITSQVNGSPPPLFSNWISGVLFRKVPN